MLHQLLSLANSHHTDIQIDRFITAKSGGTAYGCLFQCLRELQSRYDNLRVQSANISLAKLSGIESIQQEISLRTFSHTAREFTRFYCLSVALFNQLGFDQEFPTKEILDKLEAERWEYRLLADAAISILNQGTISGTVLSTIQCLPSAMRKRLLERCYGIDNSQTARQQALGNLVSWFMEYEYDLPEPIKLSPGEERELLSCCVSSDLLKLLPNLSQMGAGTLLESNTQNGYISANLVINESVSSAGSVAAS